MSYSTLKARADCTRVCCRRKLRACASLICTIVCYSLLFFGYGCSARGESNAQSDRLAIGGCFVELATSQRQQASSGLAVILAGGGIVEHVSALGHIVTGQNEHSAHVSDAEQLAFAEGGSSVSGRCAVHVHGAQSDTSKTATISQRDIDHFARAFHYGNSRSELSTGETSPGVVLFHVCPGADYAPSHGCCVRNKSHDLGLLLGLTSQARNVAGLCVVNGVGITDASVEGIAHRINLGIFGKSLEHAINLGLTGICDKLVTQLGRNSRLAEFGIGLSGRVDLGVKRPDLSYQLGAGSNQRVNVDHGSVFSGFQIRFQSSDFFVFGVDSGLVFSLGISERLS